MKKMEFENYDQVEQYMADKIKELGRLRFFSSEEYRVNYPQIKKLHQEFTLNQESKKSKKQTEVLRR